MKNLITLILVFLTTNAFSKTISVYHTSDVHGWYMSRPAKWDKENSTRSVGGFAALSSLVKMEKNPYILLDSGDMFQGTPEGNFTKGMATIEYMNKLGYSAAIVGNHDYDYGEENLKNLIKAADFPLLGANVYYKKDKGTGKTVEYLKPYTVIEKAGEKIVVLGIAGRHTRTSTLPANVKHLDFKDEGRETARYMKEIEALKPDAVIIMAHIGISGRMAQGKTDISTYTFSAADARGGTVEVARAAGTAALVFGGHNHAGLLKGWKDPVTGAMVCESYWGLTDFTKADLEFDDATGRLKSVSCSLVPLWTDITGEDKEILAITEKISAEVDKEMNKPLGFAKDDIGLTKETPDSPIGNWMTDVMRLYTKSDIAFQNSAGIRNVINKGEVKIRDIFQVMPFENTLVTVTMTGAQLEKLIRDNFRGSRSAMQVSGLTVKYEMTDGNRLGRITLEKDGKEVAPGDKFKVVTNNYLTTGGTGGKTFNEGENLTDTMIPVRDALIDWVKQNKEISAPATGRFIKLN